MKSLTHLNINMSHSEEEHDSGYSISASNTDCEFDDKNCQVKKPNRKRKLKEKYEQLRITNTFLNSCLEKAGCKYEVLMKKFKNLEEELTALKNENSDELIQDTKKINNDLLITLQEMEGALKCVNSNKYDLLNNLQVAQRDMESLTLENQRLQRLIRDLQNQSNWKLEPENYIFQKKHEILIFKRKVAENKARTQKYIVHLKKENATLIQELKEKLNSYSSKCKDLENKDQLLNNKVSTLQGELNYILSETFQARQEKQLNYCRNEIAKYKEDRKAKESTIATLQEELQAKEAINSNLELEIKSLKRSPEDKTFPGGILKHTPKEDGILFSRHAPTKKFGQQNYSINRKNENNTQNIGGIRLVKNDYPNGNDVQVKQENTKKTGRKVQTFNCGLQVEYRDEDTASEDDYEKTRKYYMEKHGFEPLLVNGRLHYNDDGSIFG